MVDVCGPVTSEVVQGCDWEYSILKPQIFFNGGPTPLWLVLGKNQTMPENIQSGNINLARLVRVYIKSGGSSS